MNGGGSIVRRVFLVVIAPMLTVMTGCFDENNGFSVDPKCPDQLTDPDFDTDPRNCGGCGIVCAPLGGVPACVDGVCIADGCIEGWFDVDDHPENGCECRGMTEETCHVCLAYELVDDNVDNDCDGETDEADRSAARKGPLPATRVDCGAEGVSCLLQPGATNVECRVVWCSEDDIARGACGLGLCKVQPDGVSACAVCDPVGYGEGRFEQPGDCFDGVDNDDSGVADDGPYCEVLLTNAVTADCSGAEPSDRCPAHHVVVPIEQGPLHTLEVAMTYDFFIDRYEVTRGQMAAFFQAQGWCDLEGGERFRECDVPRGEAMLPATAVYWSEAAAYCDWVGKRLPTQVEFYRAASADHVVDGYYEDAQGPGRDPSCDEEPAPVTARCGATGPVPVDQEGGAAVIGSQGRGAGYLIATAIHHLTGNAAEWALDAYTDWCEAARRSHSTLKYLRCPAPGEPGAVRQQGPTRDVDVVAGVGRVGILLGGGFTGDIDSDRYNYQEASSGAAVYSGFRCARSFVPGPDPHIIDALWDEQWFRWGR